MGELTNEQKQEAAELLVSMLAAAPTLASELGELLGALDGGESVTVEGVQDATLREQLRAFLTALGLASPARENDGKESASKQFPQRFHCKKGGSGVLKCVADLMDAKGLADPPPMDGEAAFDAAIEVIESLAQEEGMNTVRDEVPLLLEQILEGELVILQDLPNVKITDALTRLFDVLGLTPKKTGDGEEIGYGVPDQGERYTEAVVRKLIAAYVVSKRDNTANEGTGDRKKAATPTQRRKPIGPAMPSLAMLAQAQQAKESALQISSSEGEDETGPAAAGKEKRIVSQRTNMQSAKCMRRQELKRAAEWESATGFINGSQEALDQEIAGNQSREEWMLVPPKSLGVLGVIKTMQPTNRKFQTRSARGARADLHAPKARKSQAEIEAEAAAEELMAKHRKARGASLVERHRVDGNEAKKAARTKIGGKTKFSWSREENFEERKRFTPQMYEELVQKSHELDTKFSKSISRNFL